MSIHITDREEFTKLVMMGFTIPQLMSRYNCSRGSVATAKRNWGLVGKTPNSQKVCAKNATKHCFICNTTKDISEFYSNGKTDSGNQKYKPSCKVCENKDRRKGFVEHLYTLLEEYNIEYKCLDCSVTGEYGLLDFHHRDPTSKLFEIGQSNKSTYSYSTFKEKMATEILKCDILCPTCHRRRHLFRG